MGSTLPVTQVVNDDFASCTYVVERARSSQALVIDPADSGSGRIAAFLDARGISDVLIALTHKHFDHISGVTRLRDRYASARVVCSRTCSGSITTAAGNLSRYLIGGDFVCGPADFFCEDMDYEMNWAGQRLEFIATPGHSPGSICIAVDGMLFAGDTLIFNRPTVVKLPGGSRGQFEQSLAHLLARFPGETMVYPGHGRPFRLSQIDHGVVLGKSAATLKTVQTAARIPNHI
jgi:glyoxylase-like metal-dependent hydrolase (beta-lactamase superfamily II)